MPVFSVSGRDGSAGAAGIDRGLSTAAVGNHGLRGGHGMPGEFGIPAGNITMQLSSPTAIALLPYNVVLADPVDTDVLIEGELIFPNSQSSELDTILKLDAGEFISLKAKGGNGGRGGDGGNGQNGGVGVRYLLF